MRYTTLAAEAINARGGVLGGSKFEIIAFDSKNSPQEAQLALKSAIDQGVRFINQSNASHIAGALVDAVSKHNERNPDKLVIYLNTGAVDPALTNERCSFWHFRFDADAAMKMAALTDAIAQNPQSKKVYLLNQDYAFGQAVAKSAREMLPKKRPDIEIVGDELHPLGKIKDFSPYIAKIKATGADTIITGHSTAMTFNDLRTWADANRAFVDAVRAARKQGRTVEEFVKTWTPPAGINPQSGWVTNNVQALYAEIG